jgi:hypothetical protein
LIITFVEAAGGGATACCNEMCGPCDALTGIQAGGSSPGRGVVGAILALALDRVRHKVDPAAT